MEAKLENIPSLTRNISSAARLLKKYIVEDSTYNPGKIEKFNHALELITKVCDNAHEITNISLELQK